MRTAPPPSNPGRKNLAVLWRNYAWTLSARRSQVVLPPDGVGRCRVIHGWKFPQSTLPSQNSPRAFTILEMLVVLSIIGFLAAISLPHLSGMTRANSMSTAIQQLLGDCSLARQMAINRRSTVYMVFVPPYTGVGTSGVLANEQTSFNNLLARQYSAYALVSLRSVGDQPGQANPQYLTDWKPLPDGVFIPGFKFASNAVTPPPLYIYTTNTLTGTINQLPILPFQYGYFPFPAVDAETTALTPFITPLPYIAFSPSGQLVTRQIGSSTNQDEYIPLTRGNVHYVAGSGAVAATVIETPSSNFLSNPNVIHLDSFTARAKIERNQLR